jgi:hypothetical protein
MPRGRKKTNSGPAAAPPLVGPVSVGAGMTAGLEIWRQGDRLVLVDRSADGRFADDVVTWDSVSGR